MNATIFKPCGLAGPIPGLLATSLWQDPSFIFSDWKRGCRGCGKTGSLISIGWRLILNISRPSVEFTLRGEKSRLQKVPQGVPPSWNQILIEELPQRALLKQLPVSSLCSQHPTSLCTRRRLPTVIWKRIYGYRGPQPQADTTYQAEGRTTPTLLVVCFNTLWCHMGTDSLKNKSSNWKINSKRNPLVWLRVLCLKSLTLLGFSLITV